MFSNYKIVVEDDKEVLYLYIDQHQTEFSKELFKNNKNENHADNRIKDFINKNKINFKGTTVKVLLGGFMLSQVIIPAAVNADTSTESQYQSYTVVNGDSLSVVAKKYNMSVDEMMNINNLTSTTINIGQILKVNAPLNNTSTHTVVNGDSLSEIAKKYNMSVDELMSINNLSTTTIYIGQILNLRTSPNIGQTYTVVSGDSLSEIAKKYDISVDELMRINNLSSTTIYIGQILNLGTSPNTGQTYTVVSGDSLSEIASQYNTSVDELMRINNLSSTTIYIGQILNLNSQVDETQTYTVVNGDSLSVIAKKYGMTIDELMHKNNLSSTTIYIGQQLEVSNLAGETPTEPVEDEYQDLKVSIYRSNGTVETIMLEDYIIGVVASEMPPYFHSEAIKAQALAARTYAMSRIDNGYVLSDTDTHQVYKDNNQLKAQWGVDYDKYHKIIKDAVNSTKGQTIKHNGEYIEAFYFSTSNGKTQSSQYVWGSNLSYITSVDSSWDTKSPAFNDTKTYSTSLFNSKLNTGSSGVNVKVLSRTDGGYVDKVSINGKTYTGSDVKRTFGLRSTDFTITSSGSQVTIKTKGFGHGVGMSQYGAHYMGEAGYSFDQIINHYFLNVDIN